MSVERGDPPPDARQRAAALAGGSALVRVSPKPVPDTTRAAFSGALQRAASAPRANTGTGAGAVRPDGRASNTPPSPSSARESSAASARSPRERSSAARERTANDQPGRERATREPSREGARTGGRGGEERTRNAARAAEQKSGGGEGASEETSARESSDDTLSSLAFAAREGGGDTAWPTAAFAPLPDIEHRHAERSSMPTTRATLSAPLDGAALATLLERLAGASPNEGDAWHFKVLGGAGEIGSMQLQWNARAGWRVQLALRSGREPDEAALERIEAELRERLGASGQRLERLGFVPEETSGG